MRYHPALPTTYLKLSELRMSSEHPLNRHWSETSILIRVHMYIRTQSIIALAKCLAADFKCRINKLWCDAVGFRLPHSIEYHLHTIQIRSAKPIKERRFPKNWQKNFLCDPKNVQHCFKMNQKVVQCHDTWDKVSFKLCK